ncbi:MAG: hypothetical protein ACM65M_01570 [Microcoleus sp.]
MEDKRPLTPVEIRESRRHWREWSRWYCKHYWAYNTKDTLAYVTVYLAWLKFIGLRVTLKNLTQLLKPLTLNAKFCGSLIGVSLTDGVTAPAI